ncbi:carbohydrate ABC transporter permease [Nakamurella antarctica]|uniref:Carbohydrate ABC transporter permease n=1 Tax=Nakamurella antarctica TaxID=1902245 RepID=A0A3G8ZNS0_9ACTN|nr:carbohydrate ABC transporter permease [Nakamurella antarctica]AZI58435.1 carbohydrate ABC transporter permease [Nakamurella antarctica]
MTTATAQGGVPIESAPKKPRQSLKGQMRAWGTVAWLWVAMIPFLYPFLFMVVTALRTPNDYLQNSVSIIPSAVTFEHLSRAWTAGGLGLAMGNSLYTSVIGVLVSCALATTAGFFFLRHNSRPAKFVRIATFASQALPAPVWLIPLYVAASDWGVADQLWFLGILYGLVAARFGAYLMYAYYRGLPTEIFEAARVDGASTVKQFTAIVLPLSLPPLATLAALTFVWSWGDFLLALVFTGASGNPTVTVAAASLVGQYSTGQQTQAAALVISMIPMLIVFAFAQRFLVQGALAGSVKS